MRDSELRPLEELPLESQAELRAFRDHLTAKAELRARDVRTNDDTNFRRDVSGDCRCAACKIYRALPAAPLNEVDNG
jgi:hypothetical protein